jgi:hypothetical protein
MNIHNAQMMENLEEAKQQIGRRGFLDIELDPELDIFLRSKD